MVVRASSPSKTAANHGYKYTKSPEQQSTVAISLRVAMIQGAHQY
jgi:hypothetical protein